jgi:hypothetical protein
VIPRTEQVFTFGSSSAEAVFQAFSTESVTGPHGRAKVRVSGKADRAEGLPRLWDTDTSLITFREKQLSPTKHPCYRRKVQMLEIRHMLQDNLILQARVFTLKGAVAPSASTTPSARSDPASDGGAVRDFSGNPARAGGSAGYPRGLGQPPSKGASPTRDLG